MLYITEEKAKEAGFTHHGRYHIVPIWMNDDEGHPLVSSKSMLLEWVFDFFEVIDIFIIEHINANHQIKFLKGKKIG